MVIFIFLHQGGGEDFSVSCSTSCHVYNLFGFDAILLCWYINYFTSLFSINIIFTMNLWKSGCCHGNN